MPRNIYLALGDSITAGEGISHPNFAFVRHVGDYARTQNLAENTVVVARNGWTSKDLWNATRLIQSATWEQTNVLTLLVGGNDLRRLLRRQFMSLSGPSIQPQMVFSKLQEFGFQMNGLCAHVSEWKIPHVVVATMYNPLPHFPMAVQAFEALNGITRDIAKHYRFGVVDVYHTFHGNEAYYIEGFRTGRFEDIASPIHRPIHPNNAGHKRIAELIQAHLSQAISPTRSRSTPTRPSRTTRRSSQIRRNTVRPKVQRSARSGS